jgi:hypothetical protein
VTPAHAQRVTLAHWKRAALLCWEPATVLPPEPSLPLRRELGAARGWRVLPSGWKPVAALG